MALIVRRIPRTDFGVGLVFSSSLEGGEGVDRCTLLRIILGLKGLIPAEAKLDRIF
jgi:hypothetical protein